MAKEINIRVVNTLGAIQILNLLDRGPGRERISSYLLDGNIKSAWGGLTQNANYIMSTTTGRQEFLRVIGTIIGVSILKDVTGFNKILSIGRINIYV